MINLLSDFIMPKSYEAEASPKWLLTYALQIKAIRDDLLLPAPISQLNPPGDPEVKQCPVFYPYASPRESEFINFSTKPANQEIAGSKFPDPEEREPSLTGS